MAAHDHPKKRVKPDSGPRRFTSVNDIRAALRDTNSDSLVITLTTIRNQLTVQLREQLSPQDQRLLFAKQWLEDDPGAQQVFELWDNTAQSVYPLRAPILSVLASLLILLSSHYPFHALGTPVAKALLSQLRMRRLDLYLGGTSTDAILATLKLLNALSAFAGGWARREILNGFGWDAKPLSKLLYMRRKGRKETDSSDPLEKPDIRTLYILFLLSFVQENSPSSLKTSFLQQRRDTFLSIFKGLAQDPYDVVREVLEACWSCIWSDPKVTRTLKIGLFQEITIAHMIKLYERDVPENDEPDKVPADIVHHFLLSICTRPGTGICFVDRGWYPHEADNTEADESEQGRGGKLYNKILSNIVRTLKVNEDPRQQELALKILAACPELVASYWTAASLTLEPRLSSKWIANISFFGLVISLPVPISSFLMPDGISYQSTPPRLSVVLENVLPSVNTKIHFSRGLQSSSSLVRHCTALALAKCLAKLRSVIRTFDKIANALEEEEGDGQWSRRRNELQREVRRRVPEYQVLIAFSQLTVISGENCRESGAEASSNRTKAALLAESAQRLLWLYQQCLPEVVSEARFDFGKLLTHFLDEVGSMRSIPAGRSPNAALRLHALCKLHILRLLKENDQFLCSGKMASSSRTYLYTLLKTYCLSDVPVIRATIASLIIHSLSRDALFYENMHELDLWLNSLPRTRRSPEAEAPDETSLTNEDDSVVGFLDDCIQMTIKAPHKHLEYLHNLVPSDSQIGEVESHPSPLLIMVIERLGYNTENKLLSASDVLAIVSFVRKVLYRLSGELRDLRFLCLLADRIDRDLSQDHLFPQQSCMTWAIRRQVKILRFSLRRPPNPQSQLHVSTDVTVQEFLNQVERMPIPKLKKARAVFASELVDWLHFVETPLHPTELDRLISVTERLHKPTLQLLLENIDPHQGLDSFTLGRLANSEGIRSLKGVSFDCLFPQIGDLALANSALRGVLIQSLFSNSPTIISLKRAIRLLDHRLASCSDLSAQANLLFILVAILEQAKLVLSHKEIAALKEHVFQSGTVRQLSEQLSPLGPAQKGLNELVSTLVPWNSADREIAGSISHVWRIRLVEELQSPKGAKLESCPNLLLWIVFVEPEELFRLLHNFSLATSKIPNQATVHLLDIVLGALNRSRLGSEVIRRNLRMLLRLRSLNLRALEELFCKGMEAKLPLSLNGLLPSLKDEENASLVSMSLSSRTRWGCPSHGLRDIDVKPFLSKAQWSDFTTHIIGTLLYKQAAARKAFVKWMETGNYFSHSTHHMVIVLYALLDADRCHGKELSGDGFLPHFSGFLSELVHRQDSTKPEVASEICIPLMMAVMPSKTAEFLLLLDKQIQAIPTHQFTPHLLLFGRRLFESVPDACQAVINSLVEKGVEWAIQYYLEDWQRNDRTKAVMHELIELTKLSSEVKTPLVETSLTMTTQTGLNDDGALEFARALLRVISLKPLVVNRLIQNIVQHQQFFKLCGSENHTRDSLIHFLYCLFHLHSQNTCQPTHVESLARVYGGTLSVSDTRLLGIHLLFERQRKLSVMPLLTQWSANVNTSSNALEAIRSLDPTQVFRTCRAFPRQVPQGEILGAESTRHDGQIYDPLFLTLLFTAMLSDCPPSSPLTWVELFRTNIVCLFIRTLSAKDGSLRTMALSNIIGVWKSLEDVDMQEKPHVMYILNLLKNALPPPSGEFPNRLPVYSTLILLHALRGVFYPSILTFPLTSRFLLQRPELDTRDVPMLYSMLYNSSENWKRERTWIIQFLADGMMGMDDWKVFKRRHTWDLLASLFQSSRDRVTRVGIFDVLVNLTCIPVAATFLVLQSSLLSWIEMQLLELKVEEAIRWLRVLENLVVTVDRVKLDSSMGSGWRAAFCNCLTLILGDPGFKSVTFVVLTLVARIALKLCLLPGLASSGLSTVVDQATKHLERLEWAVDVSQAFPIPLRSMSDLPSPLHEARELQHFLDPCGSDAWLWGQSVELLWRVTMTTMDESSMLSAWTALTPRLLLWRSLVGEERSAIGEWARRETVRLVDE